MIYVGLCLHTPPSLSFYAHLVLGDRVAQNGFSCQKFDFYFIRGRYEPCTLYSGCTQMQKYLYWEFAGAACVLPSTVWLDL